MLFPPSAIKHTKKPNQTNPNQKPWISCDLRSVLRARSTTFASGDAEGYKKARHGLRRSIWEAKREYRVKLEGYYTSVDPQRMWPGLKHITDYQQRSREVTTRQSALPDELNEFYTGFDALNTNRGTLPTEAAQSSSLRVTWTAWKQQALITSRAVYWGSAQRSWLRC